MTTMINRVILTYPSWIPADPTSILLTNSTEYVRGALYHTTLGDISPINLVQFIVNNQIDFVEFVDSPEDYTSPELYRESKLIAKYFGSKGRSNIVEQPNNFLDCDVFVRDAKSMCWVFGCSLSYGVGVGRDERYPLIVSQKLGLPLKNISLPGSSTRWSLRHLINSNISKSDTVIWQVTTMERFTLYRNSSVTEVILKHSTDRDWVVSQRDDQMFFDHISLINYGIMFLRSVGCRFAVVSLDSSNSYSTQLTDHLTKYKEYVYVPEWIVDRGSDSRHPGILSHKLLASHILETLKYTNE